MNIEFEHREYRAAGAQYWHEEAERDRDEEAKRDNAERLTIQLEKHLEQNEWDAQVPHPQCESQQIEVRALLAEWTEDVLENNITIAQALIEAATGNTSAITELLDGFTSWYIKELKA